MQMHSPPTTAKRKYYLNVNENRGDNQGKMFIGKKLGGGAA